MNEAATGSSPDQAPAGTQRLSNLWHSPKWTAKVVEDDLWQQADHQVQTWQEQGEDALVIWESSEWEKPESMASEDWCAVRSSQAKRLTHIKPGYYNPPGRPIFVPGMHWLAAIVVGRSAQLGPPLLAAMRWWSSRGAQASFKRDEEGKLLLQRRLRWGRSVVHIFDQGFAGAFWLGLLLAFGLRFVLRWRGDYHLFDAQGNRRKAWRIAFGKRGWSARAIWDSRRAHWVHASGLALPVTHPEYRNTPLWLVVCASLGRTPWYLLTAEPITTDEDAWRVVFAYARRWQIELTWRFDKSELADHQSTSVARAGNAQSSWPWRQWPTLFSCICWLRAMSCCGSGSCVPSAIALDGTYALVKVPLYRLRSALSRLWQRYPPCFATLGRPRRVFCVVTIT